MKKIIIYFVLALVFFALGFISFHFISEFKTDNKKTDTNNQNNTYAAGWQAASKRLVDLGVVRDAEEINIKEISGFVSEVGNNEILVKIVPLSPLHDPDLDTRIIKVNDKTEIKKLIIKPLDEFQREMKDYTDKYGEINDLVEPTENKLPARYTEQKITVSEIIVGHQVIIKTSTNISQEKEFIANEITVYPK